MYYRMIRIDIKEKRRFLFCEGSDFMLAQLLQKARVIRDDIFGYHADDG